MGIEDSTSSNRNRWKTARERNRLKARFEIQSRIASHVTSHVADEAATAALAGEEKEKEKGKKWSLEDMKLIRKYLHAVIKNVNATFSLAALSRDAELLNYPLPFLAELETGDSVSESNSGNNASKEADKKEDKKTIISEISMLLSPKIFWNHHLYQKFQEQTERETIVSDEQALPPRPRPQEQPQPATLATSKYGPHFVVHRLIPFMQSLQKSQQRQLTLMEYSSLLGRHGIVGSLLLGGLDPTISSGGGRGGRSQLASQQVLGLFHSLHHQSRGPNENVANKHIPIIPLSIWCYIIRSVIEMRMNGVLAPKYGKSEYHQDEKCQVCQNDNESDSSISMLLRFGAPCGHSFCEPCIWMHLVEHVPLCCVDVKANVVTCPVCSVEFGGFQHADGDCNFKKQIDAFDNKSEISNLSIQPIEHEIKDEVHASNISTVSKKMIEQNLQQRREQRRLESLAKFSKLPATTADLKQLSEKVNKKIRPKKEKDPLHKTWESALRPLVQGHQSQDVRIERFFKAVTSSPPMVIAYLDAGFDVNMQNIYGQTPLYIACWKGSAMVVRWLLEYGADANIRANGGSSCWSVAKKYCRRDVLGLLEMYCSDADEFDESNSYQSTPMVAAGRKNKGQVTMLIEPSVNHPGAGACIVDNALSDAQLQRLVELWRSLPISDSCAVDDGNTAKQQSDAALDPMVVSEKAFYRPSRSYFCDAEQEIQDMMEECVAAARNAVECHQKVECNDKENFAPTSLFQHIRFLHYDHIGGVLPAHVDLCRVDETSGCRSSHTFIFYLSDCKQGGETALLKNLSNPEVLAVAQPKRGRALIFPHLCPHAGQEVLDVPKVLLRGEVAFNL